MFNPRLDLAYERGTTRCRRSPAVPESKTFLLLMLSDVGGLLWSVAHLSNLHPVPVITTRPLIDSVASAPCPARWYVRVPPERVEQWQSSPVPHERVNATGSSPGFPPGVWWKNPHGCVSREAHPPVPFWSSVSAAFTCPRFTTLQMQVSFVGIGRRGSPCLYARLRDVGTLSVGFIP